MWHRRPADAARNLLLIMVLAVLQKLAMRVQVWIQTGPIRLPIILHVKGKATARADLAILRALPVKVYINLLANGVIFLIPRVKEKDPQVVYKELLSTLRVLVMIQVHATAELGKIIQCVMQMPNRHVGGLTKPVLIVRAGIAPQVHRLGMQTASTPTNAGMATDTTVQTIVRNI